MRFSLTHLLNIFVENRDVTCTSLFTTGIRLRVKMQFPIEDKHAILLLSQTKHHGAKYLMSMFPNKQWSLGGLKNIKDVDELGHRIADEGDELDQCVVNKAVGQWRK